MWFISLKCLPADWKNAKLNSDTHSCCRQTIKEKRVIVALKFNIQMQFNVSVVLACVVKKQEK